VREHGGDPVHLAVQCSVAKCARVSYWSHDGKPTSVADDLALYDRLVGAHPMHASPAEHQATPDDPDDPHPELWGNLEGWLQYRKGLPGECA
jgi:hypothetical protein